VPAATLYNWSRQYSGTDADIAGKPGALGMQNSRLTGAESIHLLSPVSLSTFQLVSRRLQPATVHSTESATLREAYVSAVLTVAMLVAGGVTTMEYATLIFALPVTIIAYLVMASFSKVLRMERAEREGQRLRRRP
jgi:predicted Kef-type K+ transport protein